MSSVFIFTIKDPVFTGKDIFLNGQKLAQIFSRSHDEIFFLHLTEVGELE